MKRGSSLKLTKVHKKQKWPICNAHTVSGTGSLACMYSMQQIREGKEHILFNKIKQNYQEHSCSLFWFNFAFAWIGTVFLKMPASWILYLVSHLGFYQLLFNSSSRSRVFHAQTDYWQEREGLLCQLRWVGCDFFCFVFLLC